MTSKLKCKMFRQLVCGYNKYDFVLWLNPST